jgi:putative membrane protein
MTVGTGCSSVAVVVLIIRWLAGPTYGHHPPQAPTKKEPIDILKERYAKGEIDKEEFEERRRVLGE